jgi:hypothetical protein
MIPIMNSIGSIKIENVTYTEHDTNRKVPCTNIYVELINDKGQKFIMPFTVFYNDKAQHKGTFFCGMGGAAMPDSRTSVTVYNRLFSGIPQAHKIILIPYTTSCLREFNLEVGEAIVQILEHAHIKELALEGPVYGLGYSTGAGSILSLLRHTQINDYFKKTYGAIKHLILFDPAGIWPNPKLMKWFNRGVIPAFLSKYSINLNPYKNYKETLNEVWTMKGDKSPGLLDIYKDITLSANRQFAQQQEEFSIKDPLHITVPGHDLTSGGFLEWCKQLFSPLSVQIITATHGIDPITNRFVKEEKSPHKRKELTTEVYQKEIFNQLNPDEVKVEILKGYHGMFIAREYMHLLQEIIIRELSGSV